MPDPNTQAPTAPLGQLIGRAGAAGRRLFDTLLAASDLEFDAWVVLNTAVPAGGTFPHDELVALVASTAVEPTAEAQRWVDAAIERGAIAVDDGVASVTATGRQLHGAIVAGIADISARLIGDLPADDVATARRILTLYTDRAVAALG
jgi:hypothetical protein